jgi:anthranilate phosphoribosyltransferase
MISECLKKVVAGNDLTQDEAYSSMMEMTSGEAGEIRTGAFLTALRMKGETADEITGFVKAMRELCVEVSPETDLPLVDTCGTGGDRLKTFNISTTAAIIAAASDVAIAKHGNRSITSKCGGADILEALGVNINCDKTSVERCIETCKISFIFAPNFHPSMKRIMPVRQELGIRTVFNILGPLTSPANADIQLLGVFDQEYVEIIADVLKNLNVKHAMVVHGFDENDDPAMDEISTIGKTKVAILENGKVTVKDIYPEDFGVKRSKSRFIRAPETMEENIQVVKDVLSGKNSTIEERAKLDMCLVNAAAILYIAGKAESLKMGYQNALETVKSGRALEKLGSFIEISNN